MDFINKYFTIARSYWQLRTARERLFILTAISLIVGAILYNAVWLPMQKSIVSLRAAMPLHTNQLAQMKSQARQLPNRNINHLPATTEDILSIIEKSLDTHALRQHMKKMELDHRKGAKLALHNVGYNNILKWVLNLDRQFGIEVTSAKFSATNTPGEINIDITFSARS